MNTRYFVGDVETTGLPPDAAACEIGFFELDEHANIIDCVSSILDPERPIQPSASAAHGLVYEDCADFPTVSQFFSESDPACYGKRIQADRVCLIAHKSSFDRQFFEPWIDGEVIELDTLPLGCV